jgi:hypothetical protein
LSQAQDWRSWQKRKRVRLLLLLRHDYYLGLA